MDCIRVLLLHEAPLSTKPDVVARLSPIVHDMAKTVETPNLLHQALAAEPAHLPEEEVVAVDAAGFTALELACNMDNVDRVKALLARGAPLSTRPDVVAKLGPIVHDMAKTVEAPDLLHQALATAVGALRASMRRRVE